jgi:hypothetical protein
MRQLCNVLKNSQDSFAFICISVVRLDPSHPTQGGGTSFFDFSARMTEMQDISVTIANRSSIVPKAKKKVAPTDYHIIDPTFDRSLTKFSPEGFGVGGIVRHQEDRVQDRKVEFCPGRIRGSEDQGRTTKVCIGSPHLP